MFPFYMGFVAFFSFIIDTMTVRFICYAGVAV